MNLVSLLATTVENDLETNLNSFNINTVLLASFILIVLVAISAKLIDKKKHKNLKKPLFIAIAITVLFPTFLMTGSSIYVNTTSDSKGPVHWHTDIEFWVCGEEIELRDPTSALSNKIGTSSYHEHDDKRIHLEGVVMDLDVDAGLEKFMRVTGGKITEDSLIIPTQESLFENDVDGDQVSNDKEVVRQFTSLDNEQQTILSVENGQNSCSDSSYAEVQTFVYSFDESSNTYSQRKLDNPTEYKMRDESIVPPGDCVIVEYDKVKARTDKLCLQYGARDKDRCVAFGVEPDKTKACNITENIPEAVIIPVNDVQFNDVQGSQYIEPIPEYEGDL